MVCESTQPVRHGAGGHERIAPKEQGIKNHQTCPLDGFWTAYHQTEQDCEPRESKGGQQKEASCRKPGEGIARWPEANEQTDCPDDQHDEDIADEVGQRATGEDRRVCHRQRAKAVNQAMLEVGCQANPGGQGTDQGREHEHTGHQIVRIAGARNENGSAKDVAEEQDEHGWLKSRDKQLVGTACDLRESAFGQNPRVSERPIESEMGTRGNIFRGQECRAFHRFLLCSRASSGGSASLTARPVSEKKTSSSVGRRRARSESAICAPSRSRTIAAR